MKCPGCGMDMEAGFLQTVKIVAFNKTRHKISMTPKDEVDTILARKALTGTDFPGFICKECGLVVFDYRNDLPRL